VTPDVFLVVIVDVGLRFLTGVGGPEETSDVRRFLLAVALQESGRALEARYQNSPSDVPGPARGWWQFEQGGGVAGVLTHAASQNLALEVCEALHVLSFPAAVWRALEGHDLLSAAFARLLLLTDPYPVPATEADGWECYCNRLWRPGSPHPETWPDHWRIASETVARWPYNTMV
jgi:hypothetical protein